jgi:hypothetical protein
LSPLQLCRRPADACARRTSGRHFAADLARVGGLMVWLDAATGTWSVSVLGTQRTGFVTAADKPGFRLDKGSLERTAIQPSARVDPG